MRSPAVNCRRWLWSLLLFLAINAMKFSGIEARSKEAYATLLYGDEFLLGVRVLGKSIKETKSTKDMVVLVSNGVSDFAKNLLEADGWLVEPISLLDNPNKKRPKRFWGVYTKLKIFNMTRYEKVVYLDADTIVVKSIEDLFKCGRFCANLKHSERMNSGVMVVEPSETVFNDMMSKVNSLYSYTGGDQGFLNSYYADFPNAHLFEPEIPYAVVKSRPIPEMQRLSTLFNADVGLYMLANKWMVNETELRVIHYTLGPLKPWDWWTAWLLKPVDVWQDVRVRLEKSLPGTGGGSNPSYQNIVKLLFAIPVCIVLFCCYQSYIQANRDFQSAFCGNSLCYYARFMYYKFKSGGGIPVYSSIGVDSSSIACSTQQFTNGANSRVPSYLGAVSIFFCFVAALVSFALSFMIIPHQVMPWTGLLLMYEWTFTSFFILFGSYLRLMYQWGKATANHGGTGFSDCSSDDYSGKGHLRHSSDCDCATCFYGLGIAVLAVIAPSLPCILGVTALFARLGLMVGGGIVLASFMTFASEHLTIRAFMKGLEDHHTKSRTRSICCMC